MAGGEPPAVASAPAHPFGFGLSYTTFAIGDVTASVDGSTIVVRGTVSNTGSRDGGDVVQVYAELPDPDAPARLIGFARVEVPARGRTPFEITVPTDRLAARDRAQRGWRTPEGRHVITTCRFAGDPTARTVELSL